MKTLRNTVIAALMVGFMSSFATASNGKSEVPAVQEADRSGIIVLWRQSEEKSASTISDRSGFMVGDRSGIIVLWRDGFMVGDRTNNR